ncbi:hypothetical protein KGQ71_02640, partial [Patescibacteria group bacterium]|nr:hypothetical protein [Patescibacteria group bacterium]
EQKKQLQIIGIGMFLSISVATYTNIFLPFVFHNFKYQSLGSLSILFLIISIAYAISVHHLFDVRIIIRRTLLYTGLLATIFAIYGAAVFLFTQSLSPLHTFSGHNDLANLVSAIIVGLSFDPIRRFLQDKTDNFLFKKDYDEQQVLIDLGNKLNGVLTLDEGLQRVMESLVKTLHLQYITTFVFQPGENGQPSVKQVKQVGKPKEHDPMLESQDFIIPYFSTHLDLLQVENLRQAISSERLQIERGHLPPNTDKQFTVEHAKKKAVLDKLTSLEAVTVLPLHLNQQLFGLLLLGHKLAGSEYSQQDLALLEQVNSLTIASIQKARLYEGEQMKSEFVSIASHELLTPISAMQGYLSMVLDEHIGHIDPQADEYLHNVYSSTRRLGSLVKDILMVSRLESGKIKIEPQEVEAGKLIAQATQEAQKEAGTKGLTVTYTQSSEPLPVVWGDPGRISDILTNLLNNAVKYTLRGSVTVLTRVNNAGSHLVVEIRDTGVGISKRDQEHLFQKFYRAESAETANVPGTGLGLYIVKTIVERMGGEMRFRSTVGKGSAFMFSLPLAINQHKAPA